MTPQKYITDEQFDTMHHIWLDDRHLSVKQTAKYMRNSPGSIHNVLTAFNLGDEQAVCMIHSKNVNIRALIENG